MGSLTYLEMQTQVKQGLGNRSDIDSLVQQAINLSQTRISRSSEYEELFADPTYSVVSNTGDDITDAEFSMPSNMRKLYSLSLITPSSATAGSFVSGETYRILTIGTTDFTAIGASANTVGVSFLATGVGSGTGTANSVSGATVYPLEGVSTKNWESKVSPSDVYNRGRPCLYTLRGTTVILWRVPDATYEIRKVFSIWPTDLSDDADVSLLENKDDMIITLSLVWLNQILKDTASANFHFAIFRQMQNDAIIFTRDKPDTTQKSAPGIETRTEAYKTPFGNY